MASIKDTAATSALNEDAYINKLYDGTLESQNKAIQEGYDASVEQLDTGKQQVQNQTSDYLKRAVVEANKAGTNGNAAGIGSGTAGAQARLTLGNQKQANASTLNAQQTAADQEFERQRSLLAQKFATQIKQAQADNDMNRAQALYEAAKAEEEQLRALRQSGASLAASQGDNSVLQQIADGQPVQRDTATPTWDGVTKNEESINKIYDAQLESERLAAELSRDASLSDLEAQQREQTRRTDESLTQAYVNALKNNGNYLETQTAYGQGSGTAGQARLARESGLIKQLTDLRKAQQGQTAANEQQKLGIVQAFGDQIAKDRAAADLDRVKALYGAAEDEEQALVDEQQFLGQQLAKQGDYSVLRKLYGLPEQQARGGGGYSQPAPGTETGETTEVDGQTYIALTDRVKNALRGAYQRDLAPEGYVGQSSVDAYNYLVNALKGKS